jgi:SOS-response transcriptional repressor LexA
MRLIDVEKNGTASIPVHLDMKRLPPGGYALAVTDNALGMFLREGSVIVADSDSPATDGDLCVYWDDDDTPQVFHYKLSQSTHYLYGIDGLNITTLPVHRFTKKPRLDKVLSIFQNISEQDLTN